MCGLAGIITWDPQLAVERRVLEGMSGRLAHRGPDGNGLYLSEGGIPQVGLVHRRLAILDLDHRADQPFCDDAGRWIVFNGEIYNFRSLRKELQQLSPGYPWRTNCDTEVLLRAYAQWGTACLDRLEGMFALAIYDPTGDAQTVFLARDRMGQKPLYCALREGQAIAFASEPGALRPVPWISGDVQPQAIADYLTWGFVPHGTIYRSIEKLPPASCMIIKHARGEVRRYFQPNAPATSAQKMVNPEEAIRRTHELVRQAVASQLVADVPLGCFLSGGIDSSIIAAAMKRAVGPDQKVLTFSIGFDDPRYDETRYAAEVAAHLKTEHRQFIVKPDAAADLPKLAEVFGEPLADSSALPTHYLSRETRQHVKVALSGDGGDELFGGYDRYRAMALVQRLGRLPHPLLRLAGKLHVRGGWHPKSALSRAMRLLASIDQPADQRYAGYLAIFDLPLVVQLLGGGPAAEQAALASQCLLTRRYDALAGSNNPTRDAVQAATAIDREFYLPEDLLTKVDRCSMLHALEVRSPFMDHRLVHFAASLPTSLLLGGGSKTLLRRAFAGELPPTVFRRRKMGFAVPIGQWLRESLRPMLHDLLTAGSSFAQTYLSMKAVQRLVDEHQTCRQDHSQRLYALLMLELWWQGERS